MDLNVKIPRQIAYTDKKLGKANNSNIPGGQSPNEITRLLNNWGGGDELALEQLMPLVYDELHKLAKQYLRAQRTGHTLQTTALIHEAYVKLAGNENKSWENRAHFFGVAANAMRHILVDYARSRAVQKRGGKMHRVELDEAMVVSFERASELVELDDALTSLTLIDERKGRVVELKYFGGLSNKEMARVLNVSTKTIIRDWQFARSWLLRALSN